MTFNDALRELGLEPGALPDDIRRAYLRGVKTRKPEVDPDGFRRLREAYEIATSPPAVLRIGEKEPEAAALNASETQQDLTSGSLRMLLESLLSLQKDGALDQSRALLDRLREQIKASGQEIALLADSGVGAALWALTQELVQLPDSFPPAIRSAIARALLAGDPAAAVPELQALAKEDPESAEKAAFHLRRLKNLSDYCFVLAQIGPRVDLGPAQRSSQESVGVLFTLFRVLLFLALFAASMRSCH